MNWPDHGGQPETIKKLLNLEQNKKLLDFSANLNPLGPPSYLEEALQQAYSQVSRYPDPTYAATSEIVAKTDGVKPENLLLTNGGAEGVFLIAKFLEQKKALIVQPTFSEYERACSVYGIEIEHLYYDIEPEFRFPLEQILAGLEKADAIFLCRPNNPSGTVVERKTILRLLQTGKYVVIDEAFVHFMHEDRESLSHLISTYPNLIILRSLTKMYTIPGLRIGYVLADETAIETMRQMQIPWSVNGIVISLLPRLLADKHFVAGSRLYLQQQFHALKTELISLDFYVSPSEANFYLLRDNQHHEKTKQLFAFLIEHGILPRHTHNFKGLDGAYLRLAVRAKEENEQLINVLQKWRELY